MDKYQNGEVMLAMLVVMMVVIWLGNGHIGMMEHDSFQAKQSGGTEQQIMAEQPPLPPKASLEPQH